MSAPETKSRPYDRQPNESTPAYAAFKAYLDMVPKRSTRDIARQLRKSATIVGRWSSRWQWQARLRAFDADQSECARAAMDAEAKFKAVEWSKREQSVREREWKLAEQLIAKANDMLAFPLAQKKTTDGGKTVIINPTKWALSDVARMGDVASKLMRLSTGQATEKHEHRGDPNAPPVALGTVTIYLPENGRDKPKA